MSAPLPAIASSLQESTTSIPRIKFKNMSLSAIMQTQKYADLLKEIKEMPKTELHAHLGGAVPLEFLQKHCTAEAFAELQHHLERIKNGEDYSKAFQVFDLIRNIVNTDELSEEAAYSFCQAQADDCVTLTEVRTGLKDFGTGFEGYLQAVLRGLHRGQQDFQVKVNLILSLRRNTPAKDAEETVRLAIKYRNQGITGIDISGESTIGDCSTIFESIDLAKKNGFPITLHIGEQPSESPEQQMKELTRIEPQRIGHAVHLCPQALEWVDKNRPVIEACIKSALSVQMIASPAEHPAFRFINQSHRVVFCSDDSTLFGDQSSELAVAACIMNLSPKRIQEMQVEAQDYAFASPTFEIIPNVLDEEAINILKQVTDSETGEEQWYGRTTFWNESYHAQVNGQQVDIEHTKSHPCNAAVDKLTILFLETLKRFDLDLSIRKFNLEIYIDRKVVTKNDSAASGLLWHRDRVTTAGGDGFADYSIVYLMTPEEQWKGGEMLLQLGGEAISRREWKRSAAPLVTLQPRYNQAVVFKNSDSAHSITPIEPVNDSLQRDVVVITAVLDKGG